MIRVIRTGLLISIFSVALIGQTHAAINLRLAEGIELLAINGHAPSEAVKSANKPRLTLDNGVNQLLLRYGTEIQVAGNEREYARSEIFVVRFEASDSRIVLQAPSLRSQRDLKRFNRAPEWRLTTRAGAVVPVQIAPLKKEGFQLNRDYLAELAEFNRGASVAAYTPQAQARAAEALDAAPQAINADRSESERALEMLTYWYQKADPDTRRKFQGWLDRSGLRPPNNN
ncbi:MAG: DUF2057 domain-containing protein [Motiliproteus sp.]